MEKWQESRGSFTFRNSKENFTIEYIQPNPIEVRTKDDFIVRIISNPKIDQCNKQTSNREYPLN